MNLQDKIDRILSKTAPNTLRKARLELSSNYREKNSSLTIFSDPAKSLAYLATRFPATFAAVQKVCAQIPECQTLLDLGAGPATATLALLELFPHLQSTLIERSPEAIVLGKRLLEGQKWICQDMKELKEFPKADLCVLSYSLGEIKPLETFLERIWKADLETIAIIEPGTKAGYQTILEARNILISLKANIVAPCPHALKCPLKGDDWCHFSTRLERTKLHRLLKEGSLGYEDEKFSYLIVSKKWTHPKGDRVLRHPFKGSGFVRFQLCAEEGEGKERIVSRKDKEIYRSARDAKWGDIINFF